MERAPFLYLACIIAGFALIKVPLETFLYPLAPLASIVGQITVLVFSCVLIIHGVFVLVGKR